MDKFNVTYARTAWGVLKKDQALLLKPIITRGWYHRKKVEPREGSGLMVVH